MLPTAFWDAFKDHNFLEFQKSALWTGSVAATKHFSPPFFGSCQACTFPLTSFAHLVVYLNVWQSCNEWDAEKQLSHVVMPRSLSCSVKAVEDIMTSCFMRLWHKHSGVCRKLLVRWWRAKATDARKGKSWMSVVFGAWFMLSSEIDAGTFLNWTKPYMIMKCLSFIL